MFEQALKCHCGTVQGRITLKRASVGNRVVCHCRSCQKFANYLFEQNPVFASSLDENGGTDIFQVPVNRLKITEGIDSIACLRLSEKGLYRWYTNCCKTPIGNTMGAAMPFIGVVHSFMQMANYEDNDIHLGSVTVYCQTQHALQEVNSTPNHPAFSIPLTMGLMTKILSWKIRRFNKPSVFFNDEGEPLAEAKILNQ